MSITSIINRNNYTGNDSTAVYPYTFKVFTKNDFEVKVRNTSTGVETLLVVDVNYTVSGAGTVAGGNITLIGAGAWIVSSKLTTGYELSIRRLRDIKQLADIKNQGSFYPETHEDVFDKLTMVDLQQQDSIDRTVKLPSSINPNSFNTDIPASIVGSVNRAFITNAAGDGFDVGPTADEISGAQAAAIAADASAAAAAASETAAGISETNAAASAASAAGAVATHAALTNTHGAVGALVGTSDTQVLTNKTINGADNTLTVRAANDITGTMLVGNGGTGIASSGSVGNVLRSNGSAWASSALLTPAIQRFTSGSSTYGLSYWFTVSSASATIGATYTNNSQTFTVSRTIASGTLLLMSSTGAPSSSGTLTKASGTGDATITFTSVITPLYLEVEMVGGGGGGGGSGTTNGTAATAGGNTTFGSSLLTANGGSLGARGAGISAGGTCTINSPAIAIVNSEGGAGQACIFQNTAVTSATPLVSGGQGGASAYGGTGGGGFYNAAGGGGITNSGGGGGGAGSPVLSNAAAGSGGGAGGYLKALIPAPSATYSYAVGASGTGQAAGASGQAGGAGGSGVITVTARFQ